MAINRGGSSAMNQAAVRNLIRLRIGQDEERQKKNFPDIHKRDNANYDESRIRNDLWFWSRGYWHRHDPTEGFPDIPSRIILAVGDVETGPLTAKDALRANP
jgi:hypothetical protein